MHCDFIVIVIFALPCANFEEQRDFKDCAQQIVFYLLLFHTVTFLIFKTRFCNLIIQSLNLPKIEAHWQEMSHSFLAWPICPMGAFDYTTNGVTMPTHAWLPGGVWLREDMS